MEAAADWLADWPNDWLTDRQNDWLTDRQTDWLTDRPTVSCNVTWTKNVTWEWFRRMTHYEITLNELLMLFSDKKETIVLPAEEWKDSCKE